MGEKIVIGPFNKGLRNDRPAFMIDNDSFPILINAYQFRGRIKRKRGTSILGRLKRQSSVIDVLVGGQMTLANVPIAPGTVIITGAIDGSIYTDEAGDGILVANGGIGTGGTINYQTGLITIDLTFPDNSNQAMLGTYDFYPLLPVMGLEEFSFSNGRYNGTIGFDTTYSYNLTPTAPYNIYDVSFYKNPQAQVAYPNYVPKGAQTRLTWNGENYQQFWSTNYQNAFWATNGIRIPFNENASRLGMQYDVITAAAIVAVGAPGQVRFDVAASPAIIGDFVFINEIVGMTGVNFQTGYVIAVNPGVSITVKFPKSVIGGSWGSGGIVQYLTTRKDTTIDCIRWYDGDPTQGNRDKGWVNFCPPLSESLFNISDLPAAQYYLVGGRMIQEFKDRLLIIGPVVQAATPIDTSGVTTNPIYLQDTVIYCQNGTPYYTSSFVETSTASFTSAATQFFPVLVPDNQTSTPNAWFCDTTGFGGFIQAGLNQKINTVDISDDVLIMGLDTLQTRFVYTGNDIVPFNFFIINSELGSGSTFSSINMDKGIITVGTRGFIITSQSSAQRIDLEIPDQVFQISLTDNGAERFTAIRDFINEWIYFSYRDDYSNSEFPNQTLLYNYRENTWGIFKDAYTTYGTFRKQDGLTWLTIPYTWQNWNNPWESGSSNELQPVVIAGTSQGFIMIREGGTAQEGPSMSLESHVGNVITSPDHGLNQGDFVTFTGATGTFGTALNGNVFQVTLPAADPLNTFEINPAVDPGTYEGAGLIIRMYRPIILTKQFPAAWDMGRKTRIGFQQYLLTKTINSQITLLMFLSQNSTTAWNDLGVVPDLSQNNSLIYSSILYTCPESTNIGLTPANTNLANLTQINGDGSISNNQGQIWHRVNTSLIGDTIQLGFTLSDVQMRALNLDEDGIEIPGSFISQFSEIEIMGVIMDISPSGWLS